MKIEDTKLNAGAIIAVYIILVVLFGLPMLVHTARVIWGFWT